MKTSRLLSLCVAASLLAACGSDGPMPSPPTPDDAPLQLTLLHINDHHSHLDEEAALMPLATAGGQRENIQVRRGGFARVAGAIDALAAQSDNVIKIHAGDATTGDLYYNLTDGRADADLMQAVCFDTFTLGNHEFDHGDAGLKSFLDFLRDGDCKTQVLSANVRFGPNSPLHPERAPGYVQGSTLLQREGQSIGLVGLTIARKTSNSSRPDPGTHFEDEVIAAQAEIDALRAQGVNKIILQSHTGYDMDLELARQLSGVDVIVGGDSHTLLGPAAMANHGLSPLGDYPTRTTNRDGDPVCVVQAWQYSYVVGQLDVDFDAQGRITSCRGTPHVLIGEELLRQGTPLNTADRTAALADIAASGSLRITQPDPGVQALLAPYASQKQDFGRETAGQADTDLCLRRIPGLRFDPVRSTLGDTCNLDPHVIAHGGDIQQHVAQSMLHAGRQYFGAQIAIQNAGGVRVDMPRGTITVADTYNVLPFGNLLVQLMASGAELKAVLEEAMDALVTRGATGSYPYAAGLRWQVDFTQPRGKRVSRLQVAGTDGIWQPLDDATLYNVITIAFLADGLDDYTTFGKIKGDRRIDVGLGDAESFLDYLRAQPGSPPRLQRLPSDQYSTQAFIDPAPTN